MGLSWFVKWQKRLSPSSVYQVMVFPLWLKKLTERSEELLLRTMSLNKLLYPSHQVYLHQSPALHKSVQEELNGTALSSTIFYLIQAKAILLDLTVAFSRSRGYFSSKSMPASSDNRLNPENHIRHLFSIHCIIKTNKRCIYIAA